MGFFTKFFKDDEENTFHEVEPDFPCFDDGSIRWDCMMCSRYGLEYPECLEDCEYYKNDDDDD